MIIAVSGTPCTGKTSIASLLGKRLGYRVVHLNGLAEEKGLYCGYDRKRRCKIVDTGKMGREVKKISEKCKNIIIESHYSHSLPSDLVIILRCSPRELRKRMGDKGWDREKIEENVEAEIMEVCKAEALEMGKKVVEVDTTGKAVGEVVGEIVKKLNIKNLHTTK
jgi:adenylate kinase